MHDVFAAPEKGRGFLAYAALGAIGAFTALLLGAVFPSFIPASVQTVKI
jgi:hypothetical protein